MKKNDCFEMEITDTGTGGEGIGHYEGMAFFVKDAVIGDRILMRITKLKKNYGYGRVEEIIRPSTFRVKPKCPIAGPCGGCQLQAMSYEAQLNWKQSAVKEKLMRIGGIQEEYLDRIMEPILGATGDGAGEAPFFYRNKAQYPVQRDAQGQTVIGFYGAHSHRIVETEHCVIGAEVFDEIVRVIRESHDTVPYDEKTGKGLLRHVLLRRGANTGEVMVCFVVNGGGSTKGITRMVESLVQEISGKLNADLVSFCVNYNDSGSNVILGNRTEVVLGKPYIEDIMDGIRFRISAPSFYQVHPVQAERLYRKALEYAELTGKEILWDLYCGIGTISLFMARKAAKVYGIEVVPEAVENARENASINGIKNVEFFLGKAEDILPEFYRKNGDYDGADADIQKSAGEEEKTAARADALHPDVIVVDPPRKGCDEKCLETMTAMQPDRIVYVSCDPATLARDIKYLCGRGYQLKKAAAVDQFCHSVHVECIIKLQRRDM